MYSRQALKLTISNYKISTEKGKYNELLSIWNILRLRKQKYFSVLLWKSLNIHQLNHDVCMNFKIIIFINYYFYLQLFVKNILPLSQYLKMEGQLRYTLCKNFAKSKTNEKGRKLDGREFAKLSPSLRQQSHICSLLFHYWTHIADRDYFALIPRLNIQSLHHDGLAQAIISQADKSKWYLCPCAISRIATIFSPPSCSILPHWVMEHISRRDVSRIIPDRNAEPCTFFEEKFYLRYFYAVLEAAFRCASQCTSSILFEICSILFPDCEVDYLKTDDTFIPRDFYIICYNIRFIFYLFLNYNLKLVSCLRYAIFSRNVIHIKVYFSTHNNIISR